VGDIGDCPDCKDVHFLGVPGLFVYGFRPHRAGDPLAAHTKMTDEEQE
jgi:hypothetical protein